MKRAVITRRTWVWLHRWVGLTTAGFLFVAGLTGAVLAFNTELERVFAPEIFAKPRPQPVLDLAALAEHAQAQMPQADVQAVYWLDPDRVQVDFQPKKNTATGRDVDLDFTEFFTDPWTGRELARRRRGDLTQGTLNLMPFIYELHWTLWAGAAGQLLMGLAALFWTLDTVNGIYLTLPTTYARFAQRWTKAWLIKPPGSAFRLNFDLHRAGGLWFAPLLFIFAWSSVMMNIRPVYEAVMTATTDYRSPMSSFLAGANPRPQPMLSWRQAQRIGQAQMALQARLHGFQVGAPLSLMYVPEAGAFVYEVRGTRDVFERSPKGGSTGVMFDGVTGAFRSLSQPTGEHVGNSIESWLYALHMARVFGRPYQVLTCATGLVTALLSATGAYIFLRKRSAKQPRRRLNGG